METSITTATRSWEVVDKDEPLSFDERAERCRRVIEEANRNINVGFYDLALGMFEAAENAYVDAWGFKTIEDYANEVLGFGRRKAFHFIECGRAIRACPLLTRERVEKLGWTKLAMIAGRVLMLPSSAQMYLELAESKSYRELKQEIQKLESEETEREATKSGEVFYLRGIKLDGEDAKIVETALRLVTEMLPAPSMGAAITKICADWILLNQEVSSLDIDSWVGYLRSAFGVKIDVSFTSEKAVKNNSPAEGGSVIDSLLQEKLPVKQPKKTHFSLDDELDELLS